MEEQSSLLHVLHETFLHFIYATRNDYYDYIGKIQHQSKNVYPSYKLHFIFNKKKYIHLAVTLIKFKTNLIIILIINMENEYHEYQR